MGTYLIMIVFGIVLIAWAVLRLKQKKRVVAIVAGILFAASGVNAVINPSSLKAQDNAKQSSTATSSSASSVKKDSSKKESSKKASNTPKAKKSSTKKYDFSGVKLGMSKAEVIKLVGQPTEQNELTLYYGENELDFDNNGTLSDGSVKAISVAAKKKSKKDFKAEQKAKENRADLKSSAKYFGQKDVETLQKNVDIVYSSIETDTGMMYGWKSEHGMLYRDDNTETGITKVYADKNGKIGECLYTGQTIKQKVRNSYNY